MKKIFSFLLILSLFACGDNPEELCTDLGCDVIGEWNWTHTYGSIAGQTWTPDSIVMSRTVIADDSLLTFLENNIQTDQFTYEVFETDTIFNDTSIWSFIKYNGNTRILELTDSTMVFRDLCPDCYDDHYEKK